MMREQPPEESTVDVQEQEALLASLQGLQLKREESSDSTVLQWALDESRTLQESVESSSAAAHERLRKVMDLYQASVRPVKGDGNCQFRALSQQLYGDEQYHADLRAQVTKQLQSEPELYQDFVHEPYADYVSRLARDSQWGDHVTLQAASDALGLQINVFTDVPGAECIEILPRHVTHGCVQKPLCLTFLTEVHYDAADLAHP